MKVEFCIKLNQRSVLNYVIEDDKLTQDNVDHIVKVLSDALHDQCDPVTIPAVFGISVDGQEVAVQSEAIRYVDIADVFYRVQNSMSALV